MPGVSGYEAIQTIMQTSPTPILVLTGIESMHLVDVSFRALSLGALNVLSKPGGMPPADAEAVQLIQQVKVMSGVKVIRRNFSQGQALPSHQPQPGTANPRLVAIGVSTGGPPALQSLLSQLPQDFPVPIAIVQHISRGFVSGLAAWLDNTTPLACKVAMADEILEPGVVYLAGDDFHQIVTANLQVRLDGMQAAGVHRPSVDVLFKNTARFFGPAAVGVLLSGMGEDGARGLLEMHQAGAYTIAQDEATSVIFGMPKAAISLGAVREVLPLDCIPSRLNTLVRS